MKDVVKREPRFWEALFAVGQMAVVVAAGYIVFHVRIEILMIVSAVIAGLAARGLGYFYQELENAVCEKLMKATPAILIIWMIGVVIASFMFSGSIPMVIYYGLKLLHPHYIYVCSFLVCAILSTVTGTSWGSAATGGVAMMGVASGFGVPLHITAAAVICGALVGDKLSPLSETTNLAPMCCGTDIYSHMKSMLWTTIPASMISMLFFWACGKTLSIASDEVPASAAAMMDSLDKVFEWNLFLLLPFIVLFLGAFLKMPPVPVMIVSSAVALILGGVVQKFDVVTGIEGCVNGFFVSAIYEGDVAETVISLLNRGGMKSMAGIVIVVYCGYAYAAVIDKAGFLKTAAQPLLRRCKTRVSLVGSALIVNFFVAACAGSSYPAFIITGEMFTEEFKKKGMPPFVLSRTLEDSGTMLLPLVPWSAAGAFYAATLGVEAFGMDGYALYSLNTYGNPIMALILAVTGIGMYQKGRKG
ncbi:MAG: Na+/H+ antiporter NhaC [Coprococcus sp.]|nr:Na+/H+ antiporter NhaC [Coprococcus sp.]